MDTFTSLLAGCTIFSVLGYLSKRSGKEISEVTTGGAGLAFVIIPNNILNYKYII
jgi:SNF family Na+-dependent transporter